MFPDLMHATRAYWRQLDQLEAAYRRRELSLEEVNVRAQELMLELGQTRRRLLREFGATLGVFLQQQREVFAGVAVMGVIAYGWWLFNGSV